jgi:RelA/SpoT family (p)ppGpp synthetase
MIRASFDLDERPVEAQLDPAFEEELEELLELCHENLPQVDEDLIRRAFVLSYWAHRGVERASGDPYVTHPVAVARLIATDIGFDDVSVAAALMHDVVEDTTFSLEFIREEFGETMASIIDGLTKIRDVFHSRELGRAENVRKLILSMASDIRVILVKFADRLHNMRTLEALPEKKQLKIASETLDLFAPLAHRFGLFAIKSELEDLSLKVLEPKAYREIVEGLRASREEREKYIAEFSEPIRERLEEEGFEFELYGRPKHIYSIYRKMRDQNKSLEEIYDLFAIRVVLQEEEQKGREDCWRVYSMVSSIYKPLPERFRDFISVPKSNGYQSIHTTVLGPDGKPVEVQIRTQRMHEIAEYGVAAHWKYKEGVSKSDERMQEVVAWVRELLENPHPDRATEFVKEFRLNLYDEEIYVFTPDGDLMTLPQGATPVDFAFRVHTEIGFECIGAKVNGKMVPLSHELKSGDQVEIITSKKQTPSRDWINFVVTQKARSQIRHWIKRERRETIEHGRSLWEKKAEKAGLEVDEQQINRFASKLKFPNTRQMFYEIGAGLFDVEELVSLARQGHEPPELRQQTDDDKPLQIQYEEFVDTAQEAGQPALLIQGEEEKDIATEYAACCNPIPGDEVFGFISRTGKIKIHRINCRNAPDLLMNQSDRITTVEWSRQKDIQFVAAMRIVGEDRVGVVSDITTVISKNLKTNIQSITVDSEDGVFEGTIVLYVNDLTHLQRLMERIRRIDGIHGVYRFEE